MYRILTELLKAVIDYARQFHESSSYIVTLPVRYRRFSIDAIIVYLRHWDFYIFPEWIPLKHKFPDDKKFTIPASLTPPQKKNATMPILHFHAFEAASLPALALVSPLHKSYQGNGREDWLMGRGDIKEYTIWYARKCRARSVKMKMIDHTRISHESKIKIIEVNAKIKF